MDEQPLDEQPSLIERMMNSELFCKFYEYRKQALYGGTTLLVLLIGFVWFSHSSKKKEIADVQTATLITEQLKKTSKLFQNDMAQAKTNAELFSELKTLAQRDPEVRARFNGILAQEALLMKNPSETSVYAEKAIKALTASNLKFYADFSDMSYLISKNRPREALSLGQKIETHSLKESEKLLLAFTLLQQAAIERSLGKTAEVVATIEKLKKLINFEEAGDASQFVAPADDTERFVHLLQDKQNSLLDFLIQN